MNTMRSKPFDQIDLMQIAEGMKSGECICLSREDMLSCAAGMLDSLIFNTPRDSDIKNFVDLAGPNWGVSFVEDNLDPRGGWVMEKLTESAS